MSPAGMEPAGAGDIDEAPQGRAFGRNASQSNLRFALSLSWPTLWPFELCPRREWSRGSERHRRSPAGVSFREKANQSNLREELSLSCPRIRHTALCPRRESNPHLRFRKPSFSPLNYGDRSELQNLDFRCLDCKTRQTTAFCPPRIALDATSAICKNLFGCIPLTKRGMSPQPDATE